MAEELNSLLKKHQLRITNTRQDVLQLFLDKKIALSHADLEKEIGKKHDRVTLYRTLSSFEEKGLIHKVPNTIGITHYALCLDHCNEHHHHDEHIHFTCDDCQRTFCIDQEIPPIKLPQSYTVKNYSVYVNGICDQCKK